MALDDLYQEIILDHYRKPRHPGRLEHAQVEVHHYNPVCGDELTVGLRLDGDRVAAVAVDGKGCSISQAAASVMTEQVLGRPLPEALDQAEAFRRLMHGEGEAWAARSSRVACQPASCRSESAGPAPPST